MNGSGVDGRIMNGGAGPMDEYPFTNYLNMEYSNNAPVDVEATLNSLLASSPTEPYDFSASLLSSTPLRTSTSVNNANLRPFPANNTPPVTTSFNNMPVSQNVNNTHLYQAGIPVISPPPPAPVHQPFNDPFANQADKRKRRKKDDILPEEVCKGFDWVMYQSPQINFVVYDAETMRPLGDSLDLMVYKSGTNTHFSTTEKAWICYRQNQFKVFCLLKMPQCRMCLRDGAMDVEVQQFYVKLYAIKSTPMGITEEVQVGLFHAGKSRVKKEKTEIVATPFIDGRVEFTNLQFERSNAAKGQQEYFHLAVTLYAKSATAYYPVISKVSPRIIVRSQHPGFYGPPSPEQQDLSHTNTSNSNTNSEGSTSPKNFENDPAWQQIGPDSVFRMGKVGINTSDPTEALTVHGNALVTGNIYKPSDRRIKSDFVPVNPNEQLDNIRNLKIYDYKIKDRNERGVIAQELQAVMPPAVHEAGDVNINGVTVPNLLVVNERSLLYENIGATQQLDKHLEINKSNIVQIDSRVDDLQKDAERDKAELHDKIRSLSDMLFAEEMSDNTTVHVWQEEQVVFGINLFRMGPARSFMVLGYFIPYLWLVGVLYIFSSIHSRRILGRACIIKFVVWWSLHRWVFVKYHGLIGMYVYWAIGATLLLGNWRRNKRRMEARRLGRPLEGSSSEGWKCWERAFLRRSPSFDKEEGEPFLEKR
eukprot:Phypoly_transcript_01173.p1 GENE.Phypoly_transcript_01173~~Phypoly_transcript_01173.p1  ORF type:complete len:702 (-),score=114.39 Phypoly_transcript_01173:630-2735(-)